MPTRRRTVGSVIGGTLLNIASLGGVLCILAVIAAFAFNITLIMFRTGSMSPTIPTGSMAVVRQIAASEIHVGDVVTVDRAGRLPITHRVTSVSTVEGSTAEGSTAEGSTADGSARKVTLRGDANASDDAESYTVNHVRVVMFSAPGLAYAVTRLSQPAALAGVTLGAAALVTWAFWPGGTGSHRKKRSVSNDVTVTTSV